MIWLALFIFTHTLPPAVAEPLASQVVRIEEKPGQPTLAFMADGSVWETPADATLSLNRLQPPSFPPPLPGPHGLDTPIEDPEILDADRMDRWFRSMNRNIRYRSQCYNRAHIWAYEAHRDLGIRSEKVFMFFTSRYIREYHYRWWFHAAPLTRLRTAKGFEERVMDPRFFDRPVALRTWSNDFIKPRTPCKRVLRYSEYASAQNEEYCYFILAPMYVWQPKDLEQQEQDGSIKDRFLPFDVETAYQQAFR